MSDEKFSTRKFLLKKKNVTMEDCKLYIQEFHPEDKEWFYDLCCNTHENEKGKKALLPFLTIKSEFYKKYFAEEDKLSKRLKLFADWSPKPDEQE